MAHLNLSKIDKNSFLIQNRQLQQNGIDISARHPVSNNIFIEANVNLTMMDVPNEIKTELINIPVPQLTGTGGLYFKPRSGFNVGMNYHLIPNKLFKAEKTLITKTYFFLNGHIDYSKPRFEIGMSVENLLNVNWTELLDPADATKEPNYTGLQPLSARLKLDYWIDKLLITNPL